jgi:hypothetical protein
MSGADGELALGFRSLAERDRAGAPPFETRGAAARRVSPLPAVAAVAAGVMLALAVVTLYGDDSTSVAIARAQALSAWSAPTDEFLEPLDATISGSTPSLTLTSVTLPDTRSLP